MDVTPEKFQQAIDYMVAQGTLVPTYELVIDAPSYIVWDYNSAEPDPELQYTNITPTNQELLNAWRAWDEARRERIKDFRNAAYYLVKSGALTYTGPLRIETDPLRLIDEGAGDADITPGQAALTAALNAYNTYVSNERDEEDLKALIGANVKEYFLKEFVAANGNGAQLLALADKVIEYTGQNAQLGQAMNSAVAVYEYAFNVTIDTNVNRGKAHFILAFLFAISTAP